MNVEIQAQQQKHSGVQHQQDPHDFIVDKGEACQVDGIQVVHATVQDPHGHLLQPAGDQREQELQGQESSAVNQAPAATHHRQVEGEGNEGGVAEGRRARQLFGAHHDFAQVGAEQP